MLSSLFVLILINSYRKKYIHVVIYAVLVQKSMQTVQHTICIAWKLLECAQCIVHERWHTARVTAV